MGKGRRYDQEYKDMIVELVRKMSDDFKARDVQFY